MHRPKMKSMRELIEERPDGWNAIRALEQYRYWQKKVPWDSKLFRKHNLALLAFSAKGTALMQDGTTSRFTKKTPLSLPNGFSLEAGQERTTPQSISVTLTNVRCDSAQEMNQIMDGVCNEYPHIKMWHVHWLELYNTKTGAIVYWKYFNPDQQGKYLYLLGIEDKSGFRYFYDIPVYEQQRAAGNIQDGAAFCQPVDTKSVKCGYLVHVGKHGKAA